jgi:hypothetical protein
VDGNPPEPGTSPLTGGPRHVNDLGSQLKGVLSLAKQLAGGAEISLALDMVRKLKHLCEQLDLEYLNSLEEDKEAFVELCVLLEKDPDALLRLANAKASYFHNAAKTAFRRLPGRRRASCYATFAGRRVSLVAAKRMYQKKAPWRLKTITAQISNSVCFDRTFSTAIIARRRRAAPADVLARCRAAGIPNRQTAENGSSEERKPIMAGDDVRP